AGVITLHNARFVMGGVPLLYSPYWQYPLKRRSGMLLPEIGFGKRRGTEVAVPLYWAGGTNWDATLTPRWMTARGLQLALEARHAWAKGHEIIKIEGLHDKVLGTNRKAGSAKIAWQLAPALAFSMSGQYIGDRAYLADFSLDSTKAAQRYLTNQAALHWQGKYGYSELSALRGQNLVAANDAGTLQILPRLESSDRIPLRSSGLVFGLDQQSTNFSRAIGVAGVRVVAAPYLELPWQLAGGGLAALLHIGTRYNYYQLRNGVVPHHQSLSSVDASFSLRADIARVSSNHLWRHLISSTVRYDLVQAPDQSRLVNFDSNFSRLTMGNLLSSNRFTGHDRVERANRVSLLLAQSLQHKGSIHDPARELLRIAVGASYDMLRQSVDPARMPTPTQPWSNLLGEASFSPWSVLTMAADGQYDAASHYWARSSASANLHDGRNDRLQVAFRRTDGRYAAADSRLTVTGLLNLVNRWRTTGSWDYDLRQRLTRNASVMLEYNHPCWQIGVEGFRNTLATASSARTNTGFRIQFALKGVGG
ncbi:MAG: LPS assembly protein LptD, partial [Mariprofundales bacterium]|nr:LPS assembly protein LptD [Mariprofundales bacterium]